MIEKMILGLTLLNMRYFDELLSIQLLLCRELVILSLSFFCSIMHFQILHKAIELFFLLLHHTTFWKRDI